MKYSLIEELIKGIVSHPDHLVIKEKNDEKGKLFTIYVHKDDMGTMIGKKGENIKALRLVTKLYAGEEKVSLLVKEPHTI